MRTPLAIAVATLEFIGRVFLHIFPYGLPIMYRAGFTNSGGLLKDHLTFACLRPSLIRRATFVAKTKTRRLSCSEF